MYHEYPIEQLARGTSTRFQMGFARMTMHLLPQFKEVVLEPVMWVRAASPRTYIEAVIRDLVAREAQIEEVDWMAPLPVVRARVPLRQLLGYPEALAALSQSTADLRMWLSHYAPLLPDPGKAA